MPGPRLIALVSRWPQLQLQSLGKPLVIGDFTFPDRDAIPSRRQRRRSEPRIALAVRREFGLPEFRARLRNPEGGAVMRMPEAPVDHQRFAPGRERDVGTSRHCLEL
jgi:hypothetical protein